MKNIFKTGPGGISLYVENGALLATISPSGSILPYEYGPGGYSTNVDSRGRLVVSLDGVVNEIEDNLSNQINGLNKIFTLQYTPILPIKIYRNGVLCKIGENNDYVLNNNILQTNFIPRVGSNLTAIYYKEN